jgi:hypothetical protein
MGPWTAQEISPAEASRQRKRIDEMMEVEKERGDWRAQVA